MPNSRLPGIAKIEYVKCKDLPRHMMIESIRGVIPALCVAHTEINFEGTPVLSWSREILNSGSQEKSTLEFSTLDVLPEHERLAFVVTTVTGKQYIIGAHEARYPQVTFTDTTGKVGSESSVRNYKISHIALKSVLECIL